MRSRALPAVVSVATLALATALTGTAGAASSPTASHQGSASSATVLDGKSCKGGANMGTPTGNGYTAQNFESAFDAYDNVGAADFKLKRKCRIAQVFVSGISSIGGATRDITIAIYGDKGGLPDKSKVLCKERTVDTKGAITDIKVPYKCKLGKGTVGWLAVSVGMDFQPNGQWYWAQSSTVMGSPDAWKNPGGGFGVGCTDWAPLTSCLDPAAVDNIFALQKAS